MVSRSAARTPPSLLGDHALGGGGPAAVLTVQQRGRARALPQGLFFPHKKGVPGFLTHAPFWKSVHLCVFESFWDQTIDYYKLLATLGAPAGAFLPAKKAFLEFWEHVISEYY